MVELMNNPPKDQPDPGPAPHVPAAERLKRRGA